MERLLIQMPNEYEYFLAAAVVVQKYKQKLKSMSRKYELTLLTSSAFHDKRLLVPLIEDEEDEVLYDYVPSLMGWDLNFCFDINAAKILGEKTDKHVAEVFSIMLGVNYDTPLPAIKNFNPLPGRTTEIEYDVCIMNLPNDAQFKLQQWVELNRPDLKLIMLSKRDSDLTRMQFAAQSKMVVDVRSPATYLAAVLKRLVIEYYDGSCGRNWLSKWQCPGYQMIYSQDLNLIQPQLVWRAMETSWKRFPLSRQAYKEELKTVQS